MEKLKCTSCGGNLDAEENNKYAVCKHCGAKYKLDKDLNINFKIDNNTKELLNGFGMFKPTPKIMAIPIIAFAIIFTIGISFTIFDTKKYNSENAEREKEYEKSSFNFEFTTANGTKADIFVESTLDDIIQSNKTHDRKVTLVFEGNETTDEDEIIEIKHSLNGDYEVRKEYDTEGYINKIIVDKIN